MLEAIRAGAPISRAEISRRVGISKPTVSVTLESLLDSGLVRETDHDGNGPAYGATFFEPVHEAALVLGLDLGARFLRGAICDLRGEVRARQDIEMPGADVHAVTAAAADLRDRLSPRQACTPAGSTAPSPACRAWSTRRAGRSCSPPTSPASRGSRSGRARGAPRRAGDGRERRQPRRASASARAASPKGSRTSSS